MAAPQRIPPSLAPFAAAAMLLPACVLASPAAAASASIHILAPRPVNARGEWQPPDSDAGFLTTTPIVCQAQVDPPSPADDPVTAGPEHPGPSAGAAPLHWRVTVYRSGRSVGVITGSGSPFTFRPADASPRRGSGPLSIEIVAEAGGVDGVDEPAATDTENPKSKRSQGTRNPESEDRVCLRQDEIDQLRQEYLDLPGRKIALVPRREFIGRADYEREEESGTRSVRPARLDAKGESGAGFEAEASEASRDGAEGGSQAAMPSIPWAELNRTERRGGGAYDVILFTDALRDGLRRWQALLEPRALTITSGFRNPFKQAVVNGRRGREGAPGSMHQYGRAVDVRASLRQDFRDWVRVAWAALDAGADYVETAPEGGWSHVHADWRRDGQGPPLTVKLEITGRVVDADGHPVPAAQVVGASDAVAGTAGIPAWEGPDADGRFLLHTVWRAGRPYRLRAWADQSSATALISVPAGATGLVHLETDLVLAPDTLRTALLHRSLRLASRGGRARWSRRRFSKRRH